VAYTRGKSPIKNNFEFLKKPRLVKVEHPVYIWNDTYADTGITLVDVTEQGNIMIIMSINVEKSNYSDGCCDCYILNQNGKFGWALIDINSIIYLDSDYNDFST
jgi:hypothetical protein